MSQPELRISGPADQHQRGSHLIGEELIRHRHAPQLLTSGADTTQPDLRHGRQQPGPLVINLPSLRLEHLHTVITRQRRQLDPS